jgi:sporulation protein YlmC with PRC-barrel domain
MAVGGVAGVVWAGDAVIPGTQPKEHSEKVSSAEQAPAKQNGEALRASRLIGTEVYGKGEKRLGSVQDIVLSPDRQSIAYVVLSYGSVAGVGDKLFAMPIGALQYGDGRAVVLLNIEILKNAPALDKKNWQTEASAEFLGQVDWYYGGKTRADQILREAEAEARPAAAELGHGIAWDRRVSKWVGTGVEQADGKGIGEIKDVVVDWNSGEVKYAVLSFGGMLGTGDKWLAVPIERFQARPGTEKLVLDIEKEQLKSTAGFRKDQWPTVADPSLARKIPSGNEAIGD